MKKELVSGINTYLADVAVLYIKWHNVHWNVVGSQFKPVHEYLETLYDSLADVLDEVAELLKMNGETPLASMKDYLCVTTVQELDSVEESIPTVLDIVTKDIKGLDASAKAIRALANEEDAFDVVGMMEDHVGNYAKNLWFLSAMVK